jgi:hypothetical protein
MLERETDEPTMPVASTSRAKFMFAKKSLKMLLHSNTKKIENLSATNVKKVKRNWLLSKLLELIQARLITVNTKHAFQSVDDGGYWPADTTRLNMLSKAVDNYGNNGSTVSQIENYVKDNVQSVIDFAFEPATKGKGKKKTPATWLRTPLDLPCPAGCA